MKLTGKMERITIKGVEKGRKWVKMDDEDKKRKKEKERKEWEKGEKERIRRKMSRKDS